MATPTTPRSSPSPLAEKTKRLFEFLKEMQRLRTKVVRTNQSDSYREVVWFGEIPNDPRVRSRLVDGDDELDSWLTIERVEREQPPAPPDAVTPWITRAALRDSTQDEPGMVAQTQIPVTVVDEYGDAVTRMEDQYLVDHPELESLYRTWLPTWTEWAAADQSRRAVAQTYTDLYRVYQDASNLIETYELVVGFGLLTTVSGGQPVRRHLLASRAQIELDLETGTLSLNPSAEGAAFALEEDMLDPTDAAPGPVRKTLTQTLTTIEDQWDRASVANALRGWVNGLNADAEYRDEDLPHRGEGETVIVSYAPALMLRERNKRNLISVFENIIAHVDDGTAVPAGVAALVETSDGRADSSAVEAWQRTFADNETYFPLPANDQQRQIVERLRDQRMVVVQGPPGTGKTHTIANLITDLVAHGQRVLITSHTARALRVLKDKLPVEIQDLCVSITDDAVKGQSDLESSVNTILAKRTEWDEKRSDAAYRRLVKALEAARERESEALAALQDLRAQELEELAPDVGDYAGTMQSIAARLREEEATLGWLPGEVVGDPPLTSKQLLDFVTAMRAVTDDVRARAARALPAEDELPVGRVAELSALRHSIAGVIDNQEAVRSGPLYAAVLALPPQDRVVLAAASHDFLVRYRAVSGRREPWVAGAVGDVLAGRINTITQKAQESATIIASANAYAQALGGHQVLGCEQMELGIALEQVRELREHLAAGRALSRMGVRSRAAREAEQLLSTVRVDGHAPETVALIDMVGNHLSLEAALRHGELAWGMAPVGTPGQRLAVLVDESAVLNEVLALALPLQALIDRCSPSSPVALPNMPPLEWRDPVTIEHLRHVLDAAEIDERKLELDTQLAPAESALRAVIAANGATPVAGEMLAALTNLDPVAYEKAQADMTAVRAANEVVAVHKKARAVVHRKLPALTEWIESTPDQGWETWLHSFEQAWAWAAWDQWIKERVDPANELEWRTELANATTEREKVLRKIAENRGWAQCLGRLTPVESQALQMYSTAVRRLGKGTGKYAQRHQADARAHLEECQSAIPAWIMPLHRVAATVSVDQPNIFDVVIIDEASQSGLEGLFLTWLAPRIVVVGDDKQIGPQSIGLDHEAVYTLQDSYLPDIPIKNMFSPTGTLFDLATTLSQGGRITLLEHFRCMPEIIEFSNERFYEGALLPLRQYGADRLPPLRTTLVRGAMVHGRNQTVVNEAEADAVVTQIVACCGDSAYDGKTMGVVTLLGAQQDRIITEQLMEQLGPRELEQRQLRVGNAEAFQGDERHVMFMSMVSSKQGTDGPRTIGALTKTSDQQRFNVAASRAQDQVWLFHSVTQTDLSSKDLRHQYLNYVLRPPTEGGVGELEVSRDVRHEQFDSLFEQRVYLDITARGYTVRPQFAAGGYRIDLVVEGGTHRLAVECDGDEFHGIDQQDDDAARQRDLERVGWRFWRVRGSNYFRNPTAALETLWELLDELGIEPRLSAPTHEVWATAIDAAPMIVDELVELVELVEPVASSGDALVDRIEHDAQLDGVRTPPSPASSEGNVAAAAPAVPAHGGRRVTARGKRPISSSAYGLVSAELMACVTALATEPAETVAADRTAAAAEYTARAERQETLRTRVAYLKSVVEQSVEQADYLGGERVGPGCVVTVSFDGDEERYAIVQPYATPALPPGVNPLSPDSPLGRALEGAPLGDTVEYETPRGLARCRVAAISG